MTAKVSHAATPAKRAAGQRSSAPQVSSQRSSSSARVTRGASAHGAKC